MSRISRAVGGSKSTLYTYFQTKDELFAEFMTAEIARRVALTFSVPAAAGNVEAALRTLGRLYVEMFSDPTVVALYRTVVQARHRFPEIGRRFMEAGPRTAIELLSRYLTKAAEAKALSIPDVERAAEQFLALCQGYLVQDLLLGMAQAPNRGEIEERVDVALDAFFAIYPPSEPQVRPQ